MAPATTSLPWILRTERRRVHWSFALAIAPALACLPALPPRDSPTWSFTLIVVWYAAYLLVYATVTALAFTRDFATLRSEHLRRTGTRWQRVWAVGQRTENAVAFSVVALAAAVVLAITGASGRSLVLTGGTVALVLAAWLNVLVSFAAEYARQDGRHGGLEFPGEAPRSFSDHLYFSAAVTTTFGPTDVTVTTRATRRRVLLHGLVAFVVNTVVLALLISTLLG